MIEVQTKSKKMAREMGSDHSESDEDSSEGDFGTSMNLASCTSVNSSLGFCFDSLAFQVGFFGCDGGPRTV